MMNENQEVVIPGDVINYIRLARKTTHKPERDYYVECAKSLLRRLGVDTSQLSEDPHVALLELEQQVHEGKCEVPKPPSRLPYQELLEEVK